MFSSAAMELPEINYREYNGKKYSFVYGVSGRDFLLNASVCFSHADKEVYLLPCWPHQQDSYYFNLLLSQLIKLDTRTKQTELWEEEGSSPSEPVFVARPGATEEDDGK